MHSIISWVLVACLATEVPQTGDLHVARAEVALGKVRGGLPLSATFELCNPGDRAVEILEVRHGCGCLVPRLEKRLLAPGEKAVLAIGVRTLDQPAGPRRWQTHVRYRAGGRDCEITLTITAELVHEVTVRPASLTLFLEDDFRQEVTVTDHRPQALLVTDVQTTSAVMRAHLVGQAQGEAKVVLVAGKDVPSGRHEFILDIYTNDADYRHLQVPVTLIRSAKKAFSATPDQVILRGSAGRSSALVRIRGRGEQQVIIDRIETDDPAFKCTWAPGPGAAATVRIQVEASAVKNAVFHSSVRIHLAGPSPEILTVPVEMLAHY